MCLVMLCGGENGSNGCQLAVFSVVLPSCHFVPPAIPIGVLYYCRSACDICYTSKNYLKCWVIQLAIHSTVDAWEDTMNSYKLMMNWMRPCEIQYLKSVYVNIYNCVWKPAFLKSSHIRVSDSTLPLSNPGIS